MKAIMVSYQKHILCTSIIILIFLVSCQAQLEAGFYSNNIKGCSPSLVKFQDTSKGNPTYWKWDLGNGTISNQKNPSVTYLNPGTYTIKLFISNQNGADSITKIAYIQIYDNPVVNFTSDKAFGCAPLDVQFTDWSTAGTDSITQWLWDFNDGNISTLQNPIHTYTQQGEYDVKLKVTTANGCFKAIEKQNFIKTEGLLKAAFTYNAIGANCAAPTTVQFTNNSTGTGNLTYLWSFGDGSTSTLQNPVHIYNLNGTFNVSLAVTNQLGCTDTIQTFNAISIGTVQANFNIPDSICAETKLDLFNTSTPAVVSNNWYFGDGTGSTQINPSVTYLNAGTYTIKLISNFGACVDSVEKTIQVLAKPIANFTATNTTNCSIPLQTQFTNTSMGGEFYHWNFGDGTNSTLQNPTHSFSFYGMYNISLQVIATNGCSDTKTVDSLIQLIPIKIDSLSIQPVEGCVPLSVAMRANITAKDSIVSYTWHFGDSAISSEKMPTHLYTKVGTYSVKLVITSINGCTDSLIVQDAVKVGEKPSADFEATPKIACTSTGINFTDLSTNATIDTWRWSFGDGKRSYNQNPLTTYQDTGWFNVRLIVWSNGCSDTMVKPNYIYIKPPMANFSFAANNCNNKLLVQFSDSSKGAITYLWYFGDGNTSTQANPTHTYAKAGTYQVMLIAYNGDCSHAKIRTVTVDDNNGKLNISDTIICRNTNVNFTLTNLNAVSAATYTWNVGEGSLITTGGGPLTEYVYTNAGTYPVWVAIDYENGCKDTVHYNSIKVYGATAKFSVSENMFCSGSTIVFNDSSFSDGLHSIVSWNWNYGDGNVLQNNHAQSSHTYLTGGSFNIQLKVTDQFGCTDSLVKNNAVNIAHTVANFSTDTLVCPNSSIHFLNHSSGSNLTYNWNLGDGTLATNFAPVHNYNNQGSYTISLIATDTYGCADTITRVNYIKVYYPVANFSISDSTAVCPPLMVNTTNHSLYAGSSNWSFGNGSFSTNFNPSHLYIYPGNYTIKLVVKNTGGCADSTTKNVVINGPTGTFSYPATVACNPAQIKFKAITENSISNTWDYNNGVTNTTIADSSLYTYTTGGHYIPKLILEDANGCKVPIIGKDTIKVKYIDAHFTPNSKTVCDSAFVNFKDSSLTNDIITNYVWSFGNGKTSTQTNPTILFSQNGFHTVKLKVTTQTGCKDSVTYTNLIKVVSSPKLSVQGDTSVCKNGSLTFSATHVNPDTSSVKWNWNFGGGINYSIQNPPSQLFSNAGNISITTKITNSSGCENTVLKTIHVHELPNVNAGADAEICRNQTYNLQATGAKTYTWYGNIATLNSNLVSNPIAKPLTTITYFVVGKSEFHCEASDSITIKVQQPLKLNVLKADTICVGQTAEIAASGTENYKWYPALYIDKPNNAEVKIHPTKDTLMNYMLVGWDNKQCFSDTAFVKIKAYPIPKISIEQKEVTVNAGTAFQLKTTNSSDITKWKWTPAKYIDNANVASPNAIAKESIVYTCVATNEGKCLAREEVKVTVVCNNGNIFVPNTFSPNGDGVNDMFYPRGKGVYTIKSFRIFNRWGEMVFEKTNFQANDASAGWDGNYKGAKQPSDAYVYSLEIMCDNSTTVPAKGSITLLR